MKLTYLLIALTLSVSYTKADVQCAWKDFDDVVFTGFAQGFQSTKSAVSSDCFLEVSAVLTKIDAFIV